MSNNKIELEGQKIICSQRKYSDSIKWGKKETATKGKYRNGLVSLQNVWQDGDQENGPESCDLKSG